MVSEEECKEAASILGLQWAYAYDGPDDFPRCLYADDCRNEVYFNFNANPARFNLNPTYAAICKGL